jgi:hypothetical protein
MTAFLRHEKDNEHELLLETDSDKPGSPDSDKDINTNTYTYTDRRHDGDTVATSGSQVHIWSRSHDTWNSGGVCPFTGDLSELRIQELPHVNKESTPITIPLLFMEVIQLLVAETNKYSNQCLNPLKNGQ